MKETRAFSRSVLIHCMTAIFIEKVTSTHLLHSVFFFFPVLFRGIHLIETNEEVCVFYEKLNIQGKSVLTVFNHGREAFMLLPAKLLFLCMTIEYAMCTIMATF